MVYHITMDKQLLKFGEKNTADIILRLLDSEGAEYEENPLYLHSQVLRKCDFYETMLSERWALDKQRPLPITVTSTHGLDKYIKCIRFMYSSQAATKRFCLASVDDALDILPVAAQLLFHECVSECMEYLNAVRWTPAQRAELHNLLSSLQLNTSPIELAARLGMTLGNSDINQGLEFLEESLDEMLLTISVSKIPAGSFFCSRFWDDDADRNVVAKSIVGYFEPKDAALAVVDTCKRVLVKAFDYNIEYIKCEIKNTNLRCAYAWCNLLWLVNLIRRCDPELFETVFHIFSEDVSLRDAVNSVTHKEVCVKDMTNILMNGFLTPLGNGEIITPTSIRVSFLSNWLKTLVKFSNIPKDIETLETGLVNVAETLPLYEQRRVFRIWKEACASRPELKGRVSVMDWWVKTLHDAFASQN